MIRHVIVVAMSLVLIAIASACNTSDRNGVAESAQTPRQAATRIDTAIALTVTTMTATDDEPTPLSLSSPTTETRPTPETTDGTLESAPSPTASSPPFSNGTSAVEIGEQTLTVPTGYTISVFAENLGEPRFMALGEDGVLYVTDRQGRVLRIPDADANGLAEDPQTVLDGLNNPHGVTFHNGALYVAEETRVIRADDSDGDGTFETVTPIIEDLPNDGHWSRTIRFGPDGLLYLSIGSSCNVCDENDSRRAAIWRYNADGSGGEPFAVGLRNAVGITFHPETGELWTTNNGRDGMGDNVPPETINQPNLGDDFGWPRCHAGDIIDPQFGSDDACEGVAQPAVLMQAHSAPLGLEFASSMQLAPFQGDLLVAFHGSWNRTEPTGYKVVRIPFENGEPVGEPEDFVAGWLLPNGDRWGRPVDVIVASDGSLLISDDEGGRIFRLSTSP